MPTMGYLHEGHLSLFRRARRETDFVVVSIFVNPTQFGPREDFKEYPRDLKRDKAFCRKERVDILFLPTARALYPLGYDTFVEPGKLASRLCGRSRPGHFRGVATVVAKLFHLVRPDFAYFGQKDYQQALIITQMVRDLDFPIKVRICPTVRDPNGLALSSRNAYLDAAGRQNALCLVKALRWAKNQANRGVSVTRFLKAGMQRILSEGRIRVDYAEILNARDLLPVRRLSGKIVIALAGFVSVKRRGGLSRKIRLIDNCVLDIRKR